MITRDEFRYRAGKFLIEGGSIGPESEPDYLSTDNVGSRLLASFARSSRSFTSRTIRAAER